EYISALNAEPGHIDMLAKLLQQHLQGWTSDENTQRRAELAIGLGAEK
ncbi:MAG: hypothetical protein ACI965_001332, partial [Paraglaciecola sp.]